MFARKFSAYLLVLLLTTAAFAIVSFGTRADENSADVYGYYWTDSNSPDPTVTFNWIDIMSTGTDVGFYYADDTYAGTIPIGFDFEYYGTTYTQFYISCNGYIQFGSGSGDSYNDPIPSASAPNNIIAPFWDDLLVDADGYNYGAVYYETVGVAPNLQMVIEYYEVSRDYSYDLLTFEVVLNQTGEIWFQYLSMSGQTGDSASVGIEDSTGTIGCAYSYETDAVYDGLAVMFVNGLVGFGPDRSSMVDWGTDAWYQVSLTNSQSVIDSFDITVAYSYLGWVVTVCDDTDTPLIDNNGNLVIDTGDLNPGEQFDMIVYVSVPDPPTEQVETTVLLASSYLDPLVNDTVTLVTTAYQAQFSPPHASYGSDADTDGDYDSLVLEVSVESLVDGYLYLEIWLLSGFDTIDYDYVLAYVLAGTSAVTIAFPGEVIYSSFLDGPYDVDMRLEDMDGYFIDSDSFVTDSYLYTDFDPPSAMFIPSSFSDYAPDEDTDGFYDSLVVNVTFEVFDPGYYRVDIDLYDSIWGTWFGYQSEEGMYSPGVYEIPFAYPPESFNESSLDGTCDADVYLVYYNTTWVDSTSYVTASYLGTDFEGPGAVFVTPYEDHGYDSDSDSYYNQVNVTVYIECFETGLYDLELFVDDPWGDPFMDVYETLSLTAGMTVFYTFVLDGTWIYLDYLYGNFYFEMYLYYNDTGLLSDEGYDYTDYYGYWNFDEIGAYLYDIDDYGRDTDEDGYYNEIVVDVYIDPLSTGYYLLEVYIDVYDGGWWVAYDTISEVVYVLEDVRYDYQFVLDAETVMAAGAEAYFYIEAQLYDEYGSYYYDYVSHYTSYYSGYVDERYAYFSWPYDDYGLDEDLDGLYDFLVLEIYVIAPSASGYYDVEVWVSDPGWYDLDPYYFELYLEEGVLTTVSVEIPASVVWSYGNNGYWYFYADVYDHYTSDWYDSDSAYTSNYYYVTDFDPPPVEFDPPHADYGLDVDEDYLYDYLIVEAELDCYESGTYTVYADLYDYWDYYVTSVSATEAMTVGNEHVELAFEGWILYYNGVSGYYTVELTVEDDDGMTLDLDTHYTSYYYYWDFAYPPAEFSPPHSDYAADSDDDGLFENLVVNASVEAYSSGEYIVVGVLYDWYGYPVDAALVEVSLDEGVYDVPLWFSAWSICVADYDPYSVDLSLFDSDMNLMDEATYYLGMYYDQADFDPTPPMIESGWAYEPPTIDGTMTADEWFGAAVIDLQEADSVNQLAATMYVLNNETHLFILIDATGDLTESDGDGMAVAFDTLNDGLVSVEHEDQFVMEATMAGTDTSHWIYEFLSSDWEMDCEPFNELFTDHEGLAGAVGFGSTPGTTGQHRVYEMCIPLALLMAVPGDTLGFAALGADSPGVWDAEDDDTYSTWPEFYWMAAPYLDAYGDLVLKQEPPLTTVELSGDEGEAGWYVSDVEVTLTAIGGTGGVANTSYNIDGEGWQTYTEPFTITDDGAHTVQYYSIDVAGNDEPVRSVQVMIDTVAPDTSASVEGTMGDDDWITSAATVEFTVVDVSSGLSVIMYRLDGGAWTELPGRSLEVSEDGVHTLEFYAVDVAGHEESVSSIEFQVDMNAPVTTASLDGSRVTLSVTDSGSGASATLYRIDGGDWVLYEGEFEVKGKGNHTVEFYSVDAAGNNETVKSIEVQGSSGFSVLGLDWWMVVLIGALIILISIGAIFGMRRRAKDAESRAVFKDSVGAVAQMYDESPSQFPSGQEPPPGNEETPPPPG